ncbi:lung seven transmembrane receptor-domain-containing protein [Cytidiella melzeri]|nr:lung seven transmembrane receptor-domain-containing protein [Cytidiella melzeri]
MLMRAHWPCLSLLLTWLAIQSSINIVASFEVPFSDSDYDREICSGMWGGKNTYINVTFGSSSQGQLSMVIYEWRDMQYLGKVTSMVDDLLPQKTYVCTSDAVRGGFCDNSQLGHFIIDLPQDLSMNQTSFWTARVGFGDGSSAPSSGEISSNGFWDNPEGNPTPPDAHDEYTSPWKRAQASTRDSLDSMIKRQQGGINPSPSGILWYKDQPIQYLVRKTGYYCVAIVPVTVVPSGNANAPRQATELHPGYSGTVLFQNTFPGKLAAVDYPKVIFYFALFIVYTVLGAFWGVQCYRNMQDLLPIQYYLSTLLGFLIVEMIAHWAYYRYLNAHGKGTTSTVFLIVVAILDAGRNAGAFFLLLVVSLGLSVVRDSLGRTMLRCQLLAVAHFVFGVLYAIGIVEMELDSTSAFVLLVFIVPLASTLSGFLLWIMYSLNATILQLAVRKQRYKLAMFRWLHRILMMTVLMVVIFFIVSSLTFSGRLSEDYGARSWKVQWWLLDGWLSLLFLVDFMAIAYLWRPTLNNRRLAMFDELAQDEEDAEDYDMEALERRTEAEELYRRDDDDAATLVGRGPGSINDDAVVFEIGDEDAQELSDDEDPAKRQRRQDPRHDGSAHEREGLMKED